MIARRDTDEESTYHCNSLFSSRLRSRTRRLGPRTHASPHTGQQKKCLRITSSGLSVGRSFARKTIRRCREDETWCTSADETRSNGIHLVRRETRDSNGVHRVFLGLCEALSVVWTAAGLAARILLRHPLTGCATANRRAPPVRAGRGRRVGGRGERRFARRLRRAGRLRGRELDPARRGFPRCRKGAEKKARDGF